MILGDLSNQWLGLVIFIGAGTVFLLLYVHDRQQGAALSLSLSAFAAGVAHTLILLADGGLSPFQKLLLQVSHFGGEFLLVLGLALFYGRKFPKLAFGLAVALAGTATAYSFFHPSMFWLRIAASFSLIIGIDLICATLVWRARGHRLDTVLSGVFVLHALLTGTRTVQLFLPGVEFVTFDALVGSAFAKSTQTTNAIFVATMAVALIARYAGKIAAQLNQLAETDPLTGLLNRRAFDAKAPAFRAASAPLPTGLIVCDIDHFKRINDTLGHDAGDAALRAVAVLLSMIAGEKALCARLGGEEFCILLPGADAEATRLAATQMRIGAELMELPSRSGSFQLTASFGYCQLDPEHDFRNAMIRTDAAVYQAKRDGRNLVRMAKPVAPLADIPSPEESGEMEARRA